MIFNFLVATIIKVKLDEWHSIQHSFFFFVLSPQNPVCILHFQHIFIWMSHSQVVDGHLQQAAIILDSDALNFDKTAQALPSILVCTTEITLPSQVPSQGCMRYTGANGCRSFTSPYLRRKKTVLSAPVSRINPSIYHWVIWTHHVLN